MWGLVNLINSRWAKPMARFAWVGIVCLFIIGDSPVASWDIAKWGVPVWHVARPNESGLSQNDIHQFDVGPNGLIMNNSLEITESKMGGWVEANPHLTDRAAHTIVIQVTGPNPSCITGMMELVGSEADVIIANPNGLWINGGSFIHFPTLTLTTGVWQPNSIQIRTAPIHIGTNGLQAHDVGVLSMMGGHFINEGVLWTQGDFEWVGHVPSIDDHQTQNTQDDNPHASRLSVDHMDGAGMMARHITIRNNNPDVGVRLAGDIVASAGISIDTMGGLAWRNMVSSQSISIRSNQQVESVYGYLSAPLIDIQSPQFTSAHSLILGDDIRVNTLTWALPNGYVRSNHSLQIESKAIHDGVIMSLATMNVRGLDTWNQSGHWQVGGALWVSANTIHLTKPMMVGEAIHLNASESLTNQTVLVAPHITLQSPLVWNRINRQSEWTGTQWLDSISPTSGRIVAMEHLEIVAHHIMNEGVMSSESQMTLQAHQYEAKRTPLYRRMGVGNPQLSGAFVGVIMADRLTSVVTEWQVPEPENRGSAISKLNRTPYTVLTSLHDGWAGGGELLTRLGDDRPWVLATDGILFDLQIAEQVVSRFGVRRIVGRSDREQSQLLIENAIKKAQEWGLDIGAPLTVTQSEALDGDMVWLVSRNGRLEPQVYWSNHRNEWPLVATWLGVWEWQGKLGHFVNRDTIRLASANLLFDSFHNEGVWWVNNGKIAGRELVIGGKWGGDRLEWNGKSILITGDIMASEWIGIQGSDIRFEQAKLLTSGLGEGVTGNRGWGGIDVRASSQIHGIGSQFQSHESIRVFSAGSIKMESAWLSGQSSQMTAHGGHWYRWKNPIATIMMGNQIEMKASGSLQLHGVIMRATDSIQIQAMDISLRGEQREWQEKHWESHYYTDWIGLYKTHETRRDEWGSCRIDPLYMTAHRIEMGAVNQLLSQGVVKVGDHIQETAHDMVETPLPDRVYYFHDYWRTSGLGFQWDSIWEWQRDERRELSDQIVDWVSVTIANESLLKRAEDRMHLVGSIIKGGDVQLKSQTLRIESARSTQFNELLTKSFRRELGVLNRVHESEWGVSLMESRTHQLRQWGYSMPQLAVVSVNQLQIQARHIDMQGVDIHVKEGVQIQTDQMNWGGSQGTEWGLTDEETERQRWGWGIWNEWTQSIAASRDEWSLASTVAGISQQLASDPAQAARLGFSMGGILKWERMSQRQRRISTWEESVHVVAGKSVQIEATHGWKVVGGSIQTNGELRVSASVEQSPQQRYRESITEWDQQSAYLNWNPRQGGQEKGGVMLMAHFKRETEHRHVMPKWESPQILQHGEWVMRGYDDVQDTSESRGWEVGVAMNGKQWEWTHWGVSGSDWEVSNRWLKQWDQITQVMNGLEHLSMAGTRLIRVGGDLLGSVGWGLSHGVEAGWWDYDAKRILRQVMANTLPYAVRMPSQVGVDEDGVNRAGEVPLGMGDMVEGVANEFKVRVPHIQLVNKMGISGIQGAYFPESDLVVLKWDGGGHPQIWETLGHEVGHHILVNQSNGLNNEEQAERFGMQWGEALRDEWGTSAWMIANPSSGTTIDWGADYLPRTYVINGIGNTSGELPPPTVKNYVNQLNQELGRLEVSETRGIYNGGMIRNIWSVGLGLIGHSPYVGMIERGIRLDLKRNPLAKGESLNLVGYSGGGVVAVGVANQLAGDWPVNKVILLGAPAPFAEGRGRLIKINSRVDGMSWWNWDPIPLLGQPMANLPIGGKRVVWWPVAHSGDNSYLTNPKAIRDMAQLLNEK